MLVKIIDATGQSLALVEGARVFIPGFDFAEVYAHQEARIYGPGLVELSDDWVVTEPSTGARFVGGARSIDDAVSKMKGWMRGMRMTPAAWRTRLEYIRRDLARLQRRA